MKSKVIEVILLALILFMSAGILTSLKNDGNEQITEVVSGFENEEIYDTSGYIESFPYNDGNENIISKVNGKIGDGISSGINKLINWFFDLLKKLVS